MKVQNSSRVSFLFQIKKNKKLTQQIQNLNLRYDKKNLILLKVLQSSMQYIKDKNQNVNTQQSIVQYIRKKSFCIKKKYVPSKIKNFISNIQIKYYNNQLVQIINDWPKIPVKQKKQLSTSKLEKNSMNNKKQDSQSSSSKSDLWRSFSIDESNSDYSDQAMNMMSMDNSMSMSMDNSKRKNSNDNKISENKQNNKKEQPKLVSSTRQIAKKLQKLEGLLFKTFNQNAINQIVQLKQQLSDRYSNLINQKIKQRNQVVYQKYQKILLQNSQLFIQEDSLFIETMMELREKDDAWVTSQIRNFQKIPDQINQNFQKLQILKQQKKRLLQKMKKH